MDIPRKLEIAQQAIRSISRHTDEDAAFVKAALDRLVAFVDGEKAAIDAAVAARIEQKLNA